jgi:hypothetical protein
VNESLDLNLDRGCSRCGAADHEVTVAGYSPAGEEPKLDVVLTCKDCGVQWNVFIDICDMMEL